MRSNSYDKTRESTSGQRTDQLYVIDDDESASQLTERIERYNRHSSSLISKNNGVPTESQHSSSEDENPFLVQKDVEDESDDESIFDKLRDEVQEQLYKGAAVVHRLRDSRVEVMSDL